MCTHELEGECGHYIMTAHVAFMTIPMAINHVSTIYCQNFQVCATYYIYILNFMLTQ